MEIIRTPLIKQTSVIFLTGGSGFLGQRLIVDLVHEGFEVRALARSKQASAIVSSLGATPVDGDLSNSESLQKGMQGCDVIIHAAAKVETWGDWNDFLNITVQGTERIIAAARAAGVRRLIHVSTEAVLVSGGPLLNVDETMPIPLHPNGMYPKSKGLAEQLVLAANDAMLSTVVVRPRFIWGKGDTTLLPSLVHAMKSKSWIWFGANHTITTCHVSNVSHGILLATKYGRSGNVYFLTDGPAVSFRDFISKLVRTQGIEPTRLVAPLWVAHMIAFFCELVWKLFKRPGQPPLTKTVVNLMFQEITVNDAKARKELGYHPVKTIEQGLHELMVESHA